MLNPIVISIAWHVRCRVSVLKQYLLAFYWAASTLCTSGLIGFTTPKNEAELAFTLLCMLATLTIFAYVVGALQQPMSPRNGARRAAGQRTLLHVACGSKLSSPSSLSASIYFETHVLAIVKLDAYVDRQHALVACR
jgi:hypothetical protein